MTHPKRTRETLVVRTIRNADDGDARSSDMARRPPMTPVRLRGRIRLGVLLQAGKMAAALWGLALPGCGPSDDVLPVDEASEAPELAFVSDREGSADLYLTDVDTTFFTNLTRTPEAEYGASWSPTGDSLVYTRYDGGESDVWLLDLASGESRNLTRAPGSDGGADWSPNGRLLVFASARARGQSDLFTMRVDGTDIRRLTYGAGQDSDPEFAPDGRSVAFCRRVEAPEFGAGVLVSSLFLLDLATGEEVRLTEQLRFDCLPSWSPDGKSIAFHGCREGRCQIYVIDLSTLAERQVTTDAFDNRWPAYSPDGRWIAYTSVRDGGTDIWVMRPDGSDPRQVTTAPGRDEAAEWRSRRTTGRR